MKHSGEEHSRAFQTARCAALTGALWGGIGRAEHMAWPAGESLCSVSGAEPSWWLEKGGVSRGTKGCHLEGIFREWGALITGCHCQLPAGSQRPRAAPILHIRSSTPCRGRQRGRRLIFDWQASSAQAQAQAKFTSLSIYFVYVRQQHTVEVVSSSLG